MSEKTPQTTVLSVWLVSLVHYTVCAERRHIASDWTTAQRNRNENVDNYTLQRNSSSSSREIIFKLFSLLCSRHTFGISIVLHNILPTMSVYDALRQPDDERCVVNAFMSDNKTVFHYQFGNISRFMWKSDRVWKSLEFSETLIEAPQSRPSGWLE